MSGLGMLSPVANGPYPPAAYAGVPAPGPAVLYPGAGYPAYPPYPGAAPCAGPAPIRRAVRQRLAARPGPPPVRQIRNVDPAQVAQTFGAREAQCMGAGFVMIPRQTWIKEHMPIDYVRLKCVTQMVPVPVEQQMKEVFLQPTQVRQNTACGAVGRAAVPARAANFARESYMANEVAKYAPHNDSGPYVSGRM